MKKLAERRAERSSKRREAQEALEKPRRIYIDNRALVASSLAAFAAAFSCAIALYGQYSSSRDMVHAIGRMAEIAAQSKRQADISSRLASSADEQARNAASLAVAAQEQARSAREITALTERQASAMRASASLAARNVSIATQQLNDARQSDIERRRPSLILIEAGVLDHQPSGETRLQIVVSNQGTTPAYSPSPFWSLIQQEPPLVLGQGASASGTLTLPAIRPGQTETIQIQLTLPPTIEDEEDYEPSSPHLILGQINYRNVFGEDSRMPYCLELSINPIFSWIALCDTRGRALAERTLEGYRRGVDRELNSRE